MTMYATLEEAIDAAREEFLADNPGIDAEDANVQQFNAQKYVLQDGDIMWQVEFFADEGEEGECLPMLSGEAAQSVFDGDYDEIEIRQEWQEENTLHEWDEGEFQLEPPLDTEEGRAALMNPLMILVKIIKLRWIHILSYDQMVSRKINNQTTRCANSIFYTTLFTNSAPNYT